MSEYPLFDWAMAEQAREAGIQQASDGASLWWKDRALAAVRDCAANLAEFTTDDVWRALGDVGGGDDTLEPRAIGPVMRQAQQQGICEPTDRYQNSASVVCHARPKRIWRKRSN